MEAATAPTDDVVRIPSVDLPSTGVDDRSTARPSEESLILDATAEPATSDNQKVEKNSGKKPSKCVIC